MIDIETIPLDDAKTWRLISSGNTKGCFQIESNLGRQFCKKVRPTNINELSDVIAIIRPGVLEAKLDDGKNMAEHYVMRKHGEEEATVFHPILEPILQKTQNLLLYQEQTIQIGQDVAGMSLAEADKLLRKGVGKKIPELIAEAKRKFIAGAVARGSVTQTEAEEIFGWIEKGQRYLFNASHSYSYAILAYRTAYAKANYRARFFRSYLSHAKDKTQPLAEMSRMINDAKQNNINVYPPSLANRNNDFILKDEDIYFGFSNLKNIGEAAAESVIQQTPDDVESYTWPEALFKLCLKCKPSPIKILIASGAFDFCRESRKKMLFQHEKCIKLKEKEVDYIIENADLKVDNVITALDKLTQVTPGKQSCISNKRRYQTVQNIINTVKQPPYSLKDTIEEIANWEESYLGTSITVSRFDTIQRTGGETDCGEFEDSYKNTHTVICQVKRINEIQDRDGNDMAFLTVADDSGEIDSVVVFAHVWKDVAHKAKNFDILRLSGYKKKNETSFILTRCEEVQ